MAEPDRNVRRLTRRVVGGIAIVCLLAGVTWRVAPTLISARSDRKPLTAEHTTVTDAALGSASSTAFTAMKPSATSSTDGSRKATDAKRYDCSGSVDEMLAQYEPALAARLKRLDAKRKFIESTGPFTGSFGDPAQLGYPGYESYDLATLAGLGDNGDAIANILYAARQLANIRQYVSADKSFNSAAFDEHFRRLEQGLAAGQVGALHSAHYLLRLKAIWSSARNQHGEPLSNRAAVIEAHAWQAAMAHAGTLAERVVASNRKSFQLLNDDERSAVDRRSNELLATQLKAIVRPVDGDETAAESALNDLLMLLREPRVAAASCFDDRNLQEAINLALIDD